MARCATVFAQHRSQGAVAPGRPMATKKHAVGVAALPLRHRGLIGPHAVLRNPRIDGGLVVGAGWPLLGQQQGVQLSVGGVDLQRLRKIAKVAVEVDVFLRHPPAPGKTVWVERVDVEHRHTRFACFGAPIGVAQRKHLHARAAIAFGAMAGAADNQQAIGVCRAIAHHIHGQGFAVAPRQRRLVALDGQARSGSRFQELDARLGVGRAERLVDADHAAALLDSQRCASCTQ